MDGLMLGITAWSLGMALGGVLVVGPAVLLVYGAGRLLGVIE